MWCHKETMLRRHHWPGNVSDVGPAKRVWRTTCSPVYQDIAGVSVRPHQHTRYHALPCTYWSLSDYYASDVCFTVCVVLLLYCFVDTCVGAERTLRTEEWACSEGCRLLANSHHCCMYVSEL